MSFLSSILENDLCHVWIVNIFPYLIDCPSASVVPFCWPANFVLFSYIVLTFSFYIYVISLVYFLLFFTPCHWSPKTSLRLMSRSLLSGFIGIFYDFSIIFMHLISLKYKLCMGLLLSWLSVMSLFFNWGNSLYQFSMYNVSMRKYRLINPAWPSKLSTVLSVLDTDFL